MNPFLKLPDAEVTHAEGERLRADARDANDVANEIERQRLRHPGTPNP